MSAATGASEHDAWEAAARDAFADAQKSAGTADIVARVRVLPNGVVDLAWNRRDATQKRLRLGSIGGTHPNLSRIAAQLGKAAPKGQFYAIVVTASDDRDATLVVVEKRSAPKQPGA